MTDGQLHQKKIAFVTNGQLHRCGTYTQEPNPNDERAQTCGLARVVYGRNIHEQRGMLPLHSRQTIITIDKKKEEKTGNLKFSKQRGKFKCKTRKGISTLFNVPFLIERFGENSDEKA